MRQSLHILDTNILLNDARIAALQVHREINRPDIDRAKDAFRVFFDDRDTSIIARASAAWRIFFQPCNPATRARADEAWDAFVEARNAFPAIAAAVHAADIADAKADLETFREIVTQLKANSAHIDAQTNPTAGGD